MEQHLQILWNRPGKATTSTKGDAVSALEFLTPWCGRYQLKKKEPKRRKPPQDQRKTQVLLLISGGRAGSHVQERWWWASQCCCGPTPCRYPVPAAPLALHMLLGSSLLAKRQFSSEGEEEEIKGKKNVNKKFPLVWKWAQLKAC